MGLVDTKCALCEKDIKGKGIETKKGNTICINCYIDLKIVGFIDDRNDYSSQKGYL